MSGIFKRIIDGEIPCYKIAEDDQFFAFLDIRPLAPGHTLVVPKMEIDYIFDLNNTTLSGILPFASRIAKAIEKVVPCKRIGLAVVGLEVPHAHIHLIPINGPDDIRFDNPGLQISQEEMENLAKQISSLI
jgi:histidine triad (HIT) family protein